jgi:hypothetical protein
LCSDRISEGPSEIPQLTELAPLPDSKPPAEFRTAFDIPLKQGEIVYETDEDKKEAFKSLLRQAVSKRI